MPNWCNNMLEITGSKEAVARAKELVCFEKNGEYYLDFEILIPMPEPLNGIDLSFLQEEELADFSTPKYHAGRLGAVSFKDLKNILIGAGLSESFNADEIVAEAKELPFYKARMPIEEFVEQSVRTCSTYSEIPKVVLAITDMLSRDNEAYCKIKYGHSSWYGWSVANWGTKWNVNSEPVWLGADDDTSFSIGFDTAWGEPDAWFASLTDRLMSEGIEVNAYLTFGEGGMWFGGKHIYQDEQYWEEAMSDDELKEFLGIEDEDFEDVW